MRTTCNALCDFTVYANDAEIGKIKDIYFDKKTWLVRYLVVDTRRWLPGRKVLLAPKHVALLDTRTQVIRFDMTREQLSQAPSLAEHLPPTRAHEIALYDFFGWTQYWTGTLDRRLPLAEARQPLDGATYDMESNARQLAGEPHLESCKDLQKFTVGTSDQLTRTAQPTKLGSLWDFVINYVEWNVPFFVVEEDLNPGLRKFVLSTDLITAIDIQDGMIRTQTSTQSVAHAPSVDEISQLGAPGSPIHA